MRLRMVALLCSLRHEIHIVGYEVRGSRKTWLLFLGAPSLVLPKVRSVGAEGVFRESAVKFFEDLVNHGIFSILKQK